MKIKKYLVVLLEIVSLIVLGGCSVIKSSDKQNFNKEQDRMVDYLVQNYENIEKVKFTSFSKNPSTGTWSSSAIVNDTIIFNLVSLEKNFFV